MAKLWGGRFEAGLDPDAKAFSYSLDWDRRLAPYDILVNLAHAKALFKKGVFSADELETVSIALKALETRIASGDETVWGDDEDIHSCIERQLTECCGDLGKKLHTGKSRNDQVITDTRLFLKDQLNSHRQALLELLETLYHLAEQYRDRLFPGFTHFQPSQPILFSHHLLAYFEKFQRDYQRFELVLKTVDVCCLGSGAMVGNNYGLDRGLIAKELGFSTISMNSMDAVSDRDFCLEYLFSASVCMTHLSRFCEEIVLWVSPIIGFINLSDSFTTGSSIMPQKKNPDIAELIRGKSGRVLGNMVSLIHILKSLPLTYNRDLQEDKELLFDTCDTLNGALICFNKMIRTMTLNDSAIDAALEKGYLLATDFADYLVGKGVPFRESHEITGKTVSYAIQEGKALEDLSLEEFHLFSDRVQEDVFGVLELRHSVDSKQVTGGTATEEVKKQLKRIQEKYKWKKP